MPSPETLREGLQTLGLAALLGSSIYVELKLRQIDKRITELKEEVQDYVEEGTLAEEPAGEGEAREREVPEGQRIPEPVPV